MSNSRAIAAVTATLQLLLQNNIEADGNLNDTKVTILPPDKARGKLTVNQLNLFLYQVSRNPAWSNAELPRQSKPGETAYPPLPLNLYYILTAFGRDDDAAQPFTHELLGKAMSLLHDYPVINPDNIKDATSVPDADLDQQLERVRVTLHPMSVDEMSKLWTGFATQYRLSAAYEVGVMLIESQRRSAAPLPILTRGPADSGIASQTDLTPVVPTLTTIAIPHKRTSALLGDTLTLSGYHFDGTNIGVQFSHPALSVPLEVAPNPNSTDKTLDVTLPNLPAIWPAGFYQVAILVQRPGELFRRVTNQMSLTLAPSIAVAPPTPAAGNIAFTVTSAPEILPQQRVSLFLNDQEVMPDPHLAQTAMLTFPPVALTTGLYNARLRIDGVDSILIDYEATPPAYLVSQQVNVL